MSGPPPPTLVYSATRSPNQAQRHILTCLNAPGPYQRRYPRSLVRYLTTRAAAGHSPLPPGTVVLGSLSCVDATTGCGCVPTSRSWAPYLPPGAPSTPIMATSIILLAPSAASDCAIPICPVPLHLMDAGPLIRAVVQHVAASGYAGGAGDAPYELPVDSMGHATLLDEAARRCLLPPQAAPAGSRSLGAHGQRTPLAGFTPTRGARSGLGAGMAPREPRPDRLSAHFRPEAPTAGGSASDPQRAEATAQTVGATLTGEKPEPTLPATPRERTAMPRVRVIWR
jgi:hypothetical protein